MFMPVQIIFKRSFHKIKRCLSIHNHEMSCFCCTMNMTELNCSMFFDAQSKIVSRSFNRYKQFPVDCCSIEYWKWFCLLEINAKSNIDRVELWVKKMKKVVRIQGSWCRNWFLWWYVSFNLEKENICLLMTTDICLSSSWQEQKFCEEDLPF